jgi:hypothetical protein
MTDPVGNQWFEVWESIRSGFDYNNDDKAEGKRAIKKHEERREERNTKRA